MISKFQNHFSQRDESEGASSQGSRSSVVFEGPLAIILLDPYGTAAKSSRQINGGSAEGVSELLLCKYLEYDS